MQPLGLSQKRPANGPSDYEKYINMLSSSHNFTVTADVLTTAGKNIASIRETLLDGQVNIQRDGVVRRTASMTFFDPDRRLQFDSDSPFATNLFLDRMIRVTHTVTVPGVGRISATPFIGPVTTVSRDGDVVTVECQDKAALVARGRTPLTVKKGALAVAAIRRIMTAAGERHFRLPDANKRRLKKAFTVGWADEASPWLVCKKIAAYLNMRLSYSCDGYLTLRPLPNAVAVSLDGSTLTTPLKTTFDATQVVNAVRIEGTKKQKGKPKTSKSTSTKPEKVAVTAVARPAHPLSPARLGRNGAGRFLPLVVTGNEYSGQKDAAAMANRLLRDGLSAATAVATVTCVPFFHLDNDDMLSVQTDTTRMRVRFGEGSIPLGVGGDMTIGAQKRVSVRSRRG